MSIDKEVMPLMVSEISRLDLNMDSEERRMLADVLSKMTQQELYSLITQVAKLSTLIRMAALGS